MANRKDIIPLLDQAAQELDLARQHMLVVAEHVRNEEVPRFGAHVLAANGHIINATDLRDQISKILAAHSAPTAD